MVSFLHHMRHRKRKRKFGREIDQRQAFLKSLAANLVLQGKIKTTEARAKELRGRVERLVTYAKEGTLASQRLVRGCLPQKAAQKLIKEVVLRFQERKGGYTRLTKIGRRLSDGARMVFIEFTE